MRTFRTRTLNHLHALKRRLRRFSRTLLVSLSILIMLGFLISFLITLPPVQKRVVQAAVWALERELGVPVYVEAVEVALPARLVLRDIRICDLQGEQMLYVERFRLGLLRFSVWNYVFSREDATDLALGSVSLIRPSVYLYRQRRDSVWNFQFIADAFASSDTSDSSTPLRIDLAGLHIEDARVIFVDSTSQERDSIRMGHVFRRHLDVDRLNLDLSMIVEPGGQIEAQLSQLNLEERHSGFRLEHLSLELLTGDSAGSGTPYLQLNNLSLKSGSSWILADAAFPRQSLATLAAGQPMRFEALLKPNTRADMATIQYFLTNPLPVTGLVYAEGPVGGNLDYLESDAVRVRFGERTRVQTAFRLDRYREDTRARLSARMQQSTVYLRDVQALVPSAGLPEVLLRLEPLAVSGSYEGGFYDFDTELSMENDLGKLQADFHLTMPPVTETYVYEGTLHTEHLNLNALGFAESNFSPDLNLDATLQGRGDSEQTLDIAVQAGLRPSPLFGIQTDTVFTDFTYRNGHLIGRLKGVSAAGAADLVADLDLGTAPARYDVRGEVQQLDLRTLGLYPEPVRLSTEADIALTGDSLDNLLGSVELSRISLRRPEVKAPLNIPALSLSISPTQVPEGRQVRLASEVLSADVTGEFRMTRAIGLAGRIAEETRLFLLNNDSLTAAYYQQLASDSLGVSLRLGIEPGPGLNPLMQFLGQDLYVDPGAEISGTLVYQPPSGAGRGSEELALEFSADSLYLEGMGLKDCSGDVNLFKYSDTDTLIFFGGLRSEALSAGSTFRLEDLSLDTQGADGTFNSDLRARQLQAPADFQFRVVTSFDADGSIRSGIDSAASRIIVKSDTLIVSGGNSILFTGNQIEIGHLVLQDNRRYLRIDGEVSADPASRLRIDVAQLELDLIHEFVPLDYRLGGRVNSELVLRHVLDRPIVELRSRIDDFTVDEYEYGSIFLRSGWREPDNQLLVRASLYDSDFDTTLVLNGIYSLNDSVSPLNFRLDTRESFPLNYIQPFVQGQLYGIKGRVDLKEFAITGSPDSVIIKGIGQFRNAGFGVDYFKSSYTFDGDIYFDNDRITFPRITLYDKNRNHADLHGVIRHRGLQEFTFDLQLDRVRNFLVMDTRRRDNEYFYGTLFLKDGIADVTGNLDEIDVQALVSVGPDCKLKIPISDYTETGRPDYIHFKGETRGQDLPVNTGTQNFNLALTVLVTEEAEVEMIFDEQVGDIIRASGEGTLTLNIDEQGNFSMLGDYQITKGDYLFTSQNVINKKFEVRPGGRIVWDGDPYAGRIDLEAIYPVNADISSLLGLDRALRVPVNVLMHLEGLLLQPQIALAIELPRLTQEEASLIASQVRAIQYDEQELNKQVFSLMVFGRFAPVGGFLGDNATGAGITTSISELISNQFNYWLSQATNDKLNINVNTTNFQDLNLLVSARLFNDRVTIERNGTLVSNNTRLSVGNISLTIRLLPKPEAAGTRDSELVLEVFNRETFNSATQDLGAVSNQTGLGIFYKRDFDRLQDVLKKR
ncbi:MAG: translocation/assembly module TamB domain-containing protein [Bacteroidia bacterium]|nr:translocation/assembly module TamB domain-containing protein [Bacteroidia bacterium]